MEQSFVSLGPFLDSFPIIVIWSWAIKNRAWNVTIVVVDIG